MKKKLFITLLLISTLIGFSFIAYPTIANTINSMTNKSSLLGYNDNVSTITAEEKKIMISKANEYNNYLAKKSFSNTENDEYIKILDDYNNILNFNDVIGTIEIPKINVNLQIYHCSNENLKRGTMHLQNSSFPVGGKNTHSVISAHSGYPSQKFFDDIDKLEIDDIIHIYVLDEELTYKVVSKNVVDPTDSSNLQIVENKDLITLVTCYPYSVNTHRLLITAERTYTNNNDNNSNTDENTYLNKLHIFIFPLFVLSIISVAFIIYIKRKNVL